MLSARIIASVLVVAAATGGREHPPSLEPRSAVPALLSRDSQTVVAKPGELASGVLTLESENEARLEVARCEGRSRIVVFYPPFTKTRIGELKCGGLAFDRYQLEKR